MCFLLELPNLMGQRLSPLLYVRKLGLRKVVIHPRLQSKEVGEPEFRRICLGSELLISKLRCLTAVPPAPHAHTHTHAHTLTHTISEEERC